jgi:hypothetical protein
MTKKTPGQFNPEMSLSQAMGPQQASPPPHSLENTAPPAAGKAGTPQTDWISVLRNAQLGADLGTSLHEMLQGPPPLAVPDLPRASGFTYTPTVQGLLDAYAHQRLSRLLARPL